VSQTFRKKPVEIQAIQFTGNNLDEILEFAGDCNGQGTPWSVDCAVFLPTLEGVMRADIDDWIIRGILGEIYPCKPEIFEGSYVLVDQPQQEDDQ
jgi:hypothetical protein